jgi:hypothetical protein
MIHLAIGQPSEVFPSTPQKNVINKYHGVTKRCRLSWLTNSDLVYETKCGGGGIAVSHPMGTAVHTSPNKLCEDLTPYLNYDKHKLNSTTK